MELNTKLIHETKQLMLLRYPRFGSEMASANIEYRNDLKYRTAATDGKNIYFDSGYLASLSEDDRLFLIAHELMHIKFNHMFRLDDSEGRRKNKDAWNVATDAIINANLQRDGFKIKDGYINRPEALNYSAEEFYRIILDEKKYEEENEKGEANSNSNQQGDGYEDGELGDDHSLWEEAFRENSSNKEQKKESTRFEEIDEQIEFAENREERKSSAKDNLARMKEAMLRESGLNKHQGMISLGEVGENNESIDWRLLLRREIDKTETLWSQNRSIAENNYAYRLEEIDVEDEAETEVMIDVSGSVDLNLVKSFLRMLKPLLKHSKLRVGCFNEKYWGIVEIKNVRDIDNFIIPKDARDSSAWTEDWDLAVRSFSKKKEINKIVFTDGEPCPGVMPKEDLRHENVIWLVYGNKNFKPCCGRVINITEEQLSKLNCESNQFEVNRKLR